MAVEINGRLCWGKGLGWQGGCDIGYLALRNTGVSMWWARDIGYLAVVVV